MADRKQLETALINADKAGDTQAAKIIAAEIIKIDSSIKNDLSKTASNFNPSPVDKLSHNINKSAVKFGKDMITPIISPLQTAESLAHLGAGVIQKATGGGKDEVYVDAVVDGFKNRYGSIAAAANTATTDPIGMISDISGAIALTPAMLPKVGRVNSTVSNIGKAIDPVNAALNTAKYSASKVIPESAPRKLYESTAKFRPSIPNDVRSNMVNTALAHKIMPTEEGLGALGSKITALGNSIDTMIDSATKAGTKIPKGAIYRHLGSLRKDIGGVKLNAANDTKKIDQLIKVFDQHLKKSDKKELTPRELQDFKTDAYKRINFDIEQGSASYTKNEVSKAMAKAAKESLEEINPNIKTANQELGNLLELNKELPRITNRIDNHNLIGIDAPLKITAGNVAAGDVGGLLGTGMAIGGIPKVKARSALLLEQLRNSGIGSYMNNSMLPLLMRQGLLQSGRLNQEFQKL